MGSSDRADAPSTPVAGATPRGTQALAEALAHVYGKISGFNEPGDPFGARQECLRDSATIRQILETNGWAIVGLPGNEAEHGVYRGHRYPPIPFAECKHEHLGFHSGGFMVGCADCGASWNANGTWFDQVPYDKTTLGMHDMRIKPSLLKGE